MRQKALLLAVILAVGTSLLAQGVSAKDWADLQPGDVVTFLLPAAAPMPDQARPEDKLIVTGGKILNIDAAGCGGGVHPVQHYALIDPTGERSPKEGGMIVMLDEPIKPGTRLADPSFDNVCAASGTLYNRFVAVVE